VHAETDEQRAQYIAALLHERDGYERTGEHHRADEVTAELQRLEAEVPQTSRAKASRRLRLGAIATE
jgi:hypothetical protein